MRKTSFLPLLVALVGCAYVPVATQVAPGTDFASYETFAQAPAPQSDPKMPGYSAIIADRIQSEIASQLEAKGYRSAPRQSADVVVSFQVSSQPRTDVQWMGGWYDGYGDSYAVNYTAGALVIDVFDVRKGKLVWHGIGQTDVFAMSEVEKTSVEAVKAILAKYPPDPE